MSETVGSILPEPEATVRCAWVVHHRRAALDRLVALLSAAIGGAPALPRTIPLQLEVRYYIDVDLPAKSRKTRRLHHVRAPSAPLIASRVMAVLRNRKLVTVGQIVAASAVKIVIRAADPANPSEHGPSYLDVRLVEVDNPTTTVPVAADKIMDWLYVKCGGHVDYEHFKAVVKTIRGNQRADRMIAKKAAAAGVDATPVTTLATKLAPIVNQPATLGAAQPAAKQSTAELAAALGPMMKKPAQTK